MIIIFDLDGTLAETFEFRFKTVSEILKEFGVNVSREDLEKLFGLDGYTILKYFGIEPNREIIKRIMEKMVFLAEKYKHLIKPIRGVKEFLQAAKEKGIKLAVLSNSWKKDVEKILDCLSIKEYFDLILGAENVKPKPNPEGILKIMKELNDGDVIFIGDKEIDEETARRAGVKFLMIGRDFKDYFELMEKLLNKISTRRL